MRKRTHKILRGLLHSTSYTVILDNCKAALRLKKIPNNLYYSPVKAGKVLLTACGIIFHMDPLELN